MDEIKAPLIAHIIDQALHQLLQCAKAKKGSQSVADSLIFLGDPLETVPRQLLLDKQLNPREKFTCNLSDFR